MTAVVATSDALAVLVEHDGLAVESVRPIIDAFRPMYDRTNALLLDAEKITVTDATQVSEIKQARSMRLQLKAVRVEIESVRKQLKEESLRKGNSIDGLAKKLKAMIEPTELRLEEQEKFAERKEAERKAALREGRSALIAPYVEDTSIYPLGDMTDAAFTTLADGLALGYRAKIEAEKKAEADRIAAEMAKRAEDIRIRAENEKLRIEAEAANAERVKSEAKARSEKAESDRLAMVERRKAEAVLATERAAREKLEADARAAKELERKKAEAEAQAREAAALAPDRDKIIAIASAIRALPMPAVASANARSTVAEIADKREKFAAWIEQKAKAVQSPGAAQ